MRVFVYEFVTGGGFLEQQRGEPPASLRREGLAMLAALSADFAAIAGAEVFVLADKRSSRRLRGAILSGPVQIHEVTTPQEEHDRFAELAGCCDWTVVIGPEFDGWLADRCRRVVSAGGRLLGPGTALVELAADKHATAEHLQAAGVPVPHGYAVQPGETLPQRIHEPSVLKPRFGAGSQHVRLVRSAEEVVDGLGQIGGPARLERFCPGTAASVALLCGPGGCVPLVPCKQLLSEDGRFEYRGGELPLPPRWAVRAAELARRTVLALPEPRGYLGVDLVLGPDPTGREDVAIEINPRLTTSYVGLRAAAEPGSNLAFAMLAIVQGQTPRLCFAPSRVQFTPDGQVKRRASGG